MRGRTVQKNGKRGRVKPTKEGSHPLRKDELWGTETNKAEGTSLGHHFGKKRKQSARTTGFTPPWAERRSKKLISRRKPNEKGENTFEYCSRGKLENVTGKSTKRTGWSGWKKPKGHRQEGVDFRGIAGNAVGDGKKGICRRKGSPKP